MMEGLDGWDLLQRLGGDRHARRLPVLALSAARREGLERARMLGASAYLAKPFDLDVLLALVAQLVSPEPAADRLSGARDAARLLSEELNGALALTLGHARILAEDPSLHGQARERAEEAAEAAREAATRLRELRHLDHYDEERNASGEAVVRLPPHARDEPPPR